MKKIMILVLLVMSTVMTASLTQAGNNTFGVAWSLALPTGDTKDFTDSFSFRGANLQYRGFFRTDLAWGLNVSYNVFSKEYDNTYYGDNFAVTGERWTYINTVPIYLSGHKYFGNKRDGRFFLGMNGGAVWLEQRMTLGLYEQEESNWHLGLAPEIGYNFPWDSFLGFGSVRFNYLLEAGDVPSQSWFEFLLGFGLD